VTETINNIALDPLPDYGYLFTLADWDEMVNSGGITDDDGTGYYATERGMSRKHYCFDFDRPRWATHVMWFNK
jgi:hypothetical protein